MNKEKIKEILHNKKLLGGIAAGIVVLLFLAWLIIHFSFSGSGRNSALKAIPADAALILEIKQPKDLWNDLSANSIVWSQLKGYSPFNEINKDMLYLDSLFKGNEKATSLITNHPVYVSFHSLSPTTFGYLYLTALTDRCDKKYIDDLMLKTVGEKAVMTSHAFMNTPIIDVNMPGSKEIFSYTVSQNIFICSFQKDLIQSAIKQQQSATTLFNDADFAKISETAGKNVEADVYINFRYFPQLFSVLASADYGKSIAGLSSFACWSAMDVSIKKDAILLNGFTNTKDSSVDFLGTFSNQTPHELSMLKTIPSNTISFTAYSLSDFNEWYKSYITYLKKTNKFNARATLIAKLNTTNKTDIEKNFNSWIGKEMSLVVTEPSDSGTATDIFAVIKANNIENAKTLLGGTPAKQTEIVPSKITTILKKIVNKKDKNKVTISDKSAIQKTKKHTNKVETEVEVGGNKIYECKVQSVLPALFGKLFDGVEGKYYAIVNDYIVFGNTINSLKSFLNSYCDGKTLNSCNDYISFSKAIPTESNVYFYCNLKKSYALLAKYANKGITSYLSKNLSLLKNLDAFSYQFKSGEKMFYSNICIKTTNTGIDESNPLWSVPVDSTILFRPLLINDTNDKTKDIVVFDNALDIYSINAAGKILWKEKLKEKPLGEATVIDYYRNGKNQVMFNTPSYIYLIDGHGKNVENFPVRLAETSTAPMTVADYANNKDYRLIVPCGNKLYNYLKNGTINKSWKLAPAKSAIIKKASYLKFDGGDYFATSDKDGNAFIVNRKGVEKITAKTPIEVAANSGFYSVNEGGKSKPWILTTDKDGELIFISASGDIVKKNAGKFSPQHYFLYNEKTKEYVFLDADNTRLSIFDANIKHTGNYTFPEEISSSPIVYDETSIKDFIGAVGLKSQKFYLLKPNCTLKEGFPISGTTTIVTGSLNNDGSLNLIIASGSTLYNYSFQ